MSEIDPVEFGRLVQAVATLTVSVGTLEKKVDDLTELAAKGRGAWWAAMGLASIAGAFSHAIAKEWFK